MRLSRYAASSGWKSCDFAPRISASGARRSRPVGPGRAAMNFSQKCGSKLSDQPALPSASIAFSRRAAGDEVENEQVVAGLRRGETEPGDDRLERGPDAVLPRRRARRRGRLLVLRREERRIDHHRRGEFVAEIMREPDRDPAAERVPDDGRRAGLERASLPAPPPAPRARTGGNHKPGASPNAPCR